MPNIPYKKTTYKKYDFIEKQSEPWIDVKAYEFLDKQLEKLMKEYGYI